MNKMNSFVSALFVIFGICFFALIVYVSILGENHKIDFLVKSYFTNIKTRNYTKSCENITLDPRYGALINKEQCFNFSFLLELSLLKQFNLLDKNDYAIEIHKQSFWVPFISGGTVVVGIAFTEKKKNFFQAFLNKPDAGTYINDFMVVERKKGGWEIKEINLWGSSLSGVFDELKKNCDLDKYVRNTEDGFVLVNNAIEPENLSHIERRLLEFSMYKISDL